MDQNEMLAKIEFEDVPQCPVCGKPDEMVDMITDVELNRPSQSWRLCLNCGHVFVSPRPTEKFLAEFYTSGYRQMTHGLKEPESKDKIPVNSVNEERSRAMRGATTVMQLRTKVSNHLDVGSSTGALCAGVVDFLRPAHTWGVEPNDAWRGFSEGAFANRRPEIRNYDDDVKFGATLSKVPKTIKFELVTIIHTLEHLLNPREVLEECKRRMKPNGLLVVEVPNRYGGMANPLLWPHLHSFTEQTLDRLLTGVGFFPILHDSYGNFPPFFQPSAAILVIATLKEPVISLADVLQRYSQYRAVVGNVQQRIAQARPNYDIG